MYDTEALCLADCRYIEPTALYRYFSGDGALLYIGIANDIHRRDAQHLKDHQWRAEAQFIRAELFPSRRLAEAAEDWAIYEETPPHNVKRQKPRDFYSAPNMWFVEKMGGLIGESIKWAALFVPARTGQWRPPTPCEPPQFAAYLSGYRPADWPKE